MYLGSLISTTGESAPELNRRLGEAFSCFQALTAVWKHANIPKMRKYRILCACVASKLLYGLEAVWLLKAHRQKLDAFWVRCLRRIARISASFESRVTNKAVLEQFQADALSKTLELRQLNLLWKIGQQPACSFMRRLTFTDGTCALRDWKPLRRVGRPFQRWGAEVYKLALDVAGDMQNFLARPAPHRRGQ